ncbi:MAG: cytochrome c [Actinomycetota bacterium]|nr:cytochrome c [Actinomycetota bacterium]
MRCAFALAALALAVIAAGCGSASAPTPSLGATAAARTLFAGSCGGCHSLTGHDTPSRQGGDLLGVRVRRPIALEFAREMPVRPRLTEAQLGTIVDYIAAVQRGSR